MTQTVALIDYGAGNLRSMANALTRAAQDAGRAMSLVVTADPDVVQSADRIVLPGVGAFGACRAGMDAAPGLIEALTVAVRGKGRPFLGVCVGMQLLADEGREHGVHPGLGWTSGHVSALRLDGTGLKIPHMGWNQVTPTSAGAAHPVLKAFERGPYAYFVHSFAFRADAPGDVVLTASYGETFAAGVARDTVVGVQFHPEKSQAAGLALLESWLAWSP